MVEVSELVDYFGRIPPGGGARVTIFRVRLTNRPLARSAKYRQYPSHRHIPNGNSRSSVEDCLPRWAIASDRPAPITDYSGSALTRLAAARHRRRRLYWPKLATQLACSWGSFIGPHSLLTRLARSLPFACTTASYRALSRTFCCADQ